MKRIIFFVIVTLLAFAGDVVAQHRLVEEVKKLISSQTMTLDDYKKAQTKLQPALVDANTKGNAETWWVAARINFGIYDKALSSRALGKKVDNKTPGYALIEGYDNIMTCVSLDTVYSRDAKGNIKCNKNGELRYKTKFSKRAMQLLYDHLVDYSASGGELFIAEDWDGAYRAWDIYCDLALSPKAKQYKVNEPDSIVGYYRYYQALAACQKGDNACAVGLFNQAKNLGFSKKRMYDSWLDAAIKLNDSTEMVKVAAIAHELYGNTTSQYLRVLINDCLAHKNYTQATLLLSQAMEKDPQRAEYYDLMGQLVEKLNNINDAMPFYKRAVELDDNYAMGQFNLGNAYYRQALLLNNHYSPEAIELYKSALQHVERAYQLGQKDEATRLVLSRLYYLLNSDKIDDL